jgi:hypothetical protein
MFSFLGYIPDTLGVVRVEVLPAGILQEPKTSPMFEHEKTAFFFFLPFSSSFLSNRSSSMTTCFCGSAPAQSHALLGKDLHSQDDQDHTDRNCKRLASKRKIVISLELSFNND